MVFCNYLLSPSIMFQDSSVCCMDWFPIPFLKIVFNWRIIALQNFVVYHQIFHSINTLPFVYLFNCYVFGLFLALCYYEWYCHEQPCTRFCVDICFPKQLYQFAFLPTTNEDYSLSTFLPLIIGFNFSHPRGWEVMSRGFNLHFPNE